MPTSVSQLARYAGPCRPKRFDGVVDDARAVTGLVSARSSDRARTRWPPSSSGGADVTIAMTAIAALRRSCGRPMTPRRDADGGGAGRHILAHDGAGADDRAIADGHAVEDVAPAPSQAPFADGDAGRHAGLIEHRLSIGSVELVVAADQIGVGRDERARANAHAAGGKHLAVESDVRVVGELDVAVLAREDRVAADEHAAADADAGVRSRLSHRAGSCRRSRRCRRCESCADGAGRRSGRRRHCGRSCRAATDRATSAARARARRAWPGRAARRARASSSAAQPGWPTTSALYLARAPPPREQLVLRARDVA